MNRRPWFVSLVLLFIASLVFVSSAQAIYAPGTYPAKLHIAGGITITSTWDTTKNCLPGQSWTLSKDADFEFNRKVVVSPLPGGGRYFGSTVGSDPGGATVKSKISGYAETNYCPPDDPITLEQPECKSFTGNMSASLMPDGRAKKPWRAAVGFGRSTGGDENNLNYCFTPPTDPTPKGTVIEDLGSHYGSMVLPLNIPVKAFRNLRKKKSLTQRMLIQGPCDRVVVDTLDGKASAHVAKDPTGALVSFYYSDQCEVDGVINVQIKRLK